MNLYNHNLFSFDEIREQVLAFMRENGIYPAKSRDTYLILDDKIHRYQIEGRKNGSSDGAYVIHTDGIPAGFLQDWANPNARFNWSMKGFERSELPDFDIKKWEENRKQHEAELAQQRAEAIDKAYEYFQNASDNVAYHTYLDKKQVKSYGLKLDEVANLLLVPLRNIDGKLQSLQTIRPDGVKRFYGGTSTTGAFFSIGLNTLANGDNKPIFVAEGYATTAKIFQVTGNPCVAAMNCGNMEAVITNLRTKYPDRKFIVMADNDLATFKKKGYNPGIDTAEKLLMNKLIIGYVAPSFNRDNPEGSDWDDYAITFGDEAAREAMLEGENGVKQFLMDKDTREKYLNHLELTQLLEKIDPKIQLPPQEYIGGIFPRGFVSSIVAPPGTGKTIFMQKIVSDLSVGGNFFNGLKDDEPARKCLIFSAEAGYELLIRRSTSFKWDVAPENAVVVDQYRYESKAKSLMLDEPEGLVNVKDIINTVKPDIIFFDTFSSFHESDENKASEMKPIIRELTNIARLGNIAIILNHHSRKRASKDRGQLLNQDDVIGSSIFNRLVGLIIGIEPIETISNISEEKNLQVRTLKTWFRATKPFNFKITHDLYGRPVIATNFSPDESTNARVAVWNYLESTFDNGEWFSASDVYMSEFNGVEVSERLYRKIITEFLESGKLKKRGTTKNVEYSIVRFSD